MEKRNNWFVDYQDIYGKKGFRSIKYRVQYFDKDDFNDKRVLDIGCNLGQMCKFAVENDANFVLGIDYDTSVIEKARKFTKDNRLVYVTVNNPFYGIISSSMNTKKYTGEELINLHNIGMSRGFQSIFP